jgi:hypothetical protein
VGGAQHSKKSWTLLIDSVPIRERRRGGLAQGNVAPRPASWARQSRVFGDDIAGRQIFEAGGEQHAPGEEGCRCIWEAATEGSPTHAISSDPPVPAGCGQEHVICEGRNKKDRGAGQLPEAAAGRCRQRWGRPSKFSGKIARSSALAHTCWSASTQSKISRKFGA